MRLRRALCAVLAVLACGSASARRGDQDFEFDDDADLSDNTLSSESEHARRPRRYVYDPHNALCRALVCKKRELCLLRDAFTALCANKKDILRKGDVIVSAGGASVSGGGGGSAAEQEADDVFYDGEAGARDPLAPPAAPDADADAPDRCVGCGGRVGSGGFLCGSDNRTYSSLCRLDLHNCVRRPAPPVALACRGFCPCRVRVRARARTRARTRTRTRARSQHGDRAEWRRRKSEAAHNEVLPDRPNRRRLSQGAGAGAGACALDKMANRLLDWFSVLMEEAGAEAEAEAGAGAGAGAASFPPECKPEVRWMFAHLDADRDGALSAAELYALRHDERERCLRPFLATCGGAGGGVVRRAWCACLARAARPCTALARAHARAPPGGYVPACDARGYYRPRQCHAALGVCWCVDAHGAELPGSRARGAAPCTGTGAGTGTGAPQDDEDAAGAGSGDEEPRY